ncbi:MAG TPA: SPOR domain-containing protein, partial [Acidobacteriota bacterium]|nr:SPOR domain-containing protein [Acidobacteriota bacterium]
MRDYEEKSYYEIQLDNKQLILVFLAGVTVCVLVFILGVMVGKGRKEAEIAAVKGNSGTQVPVRPEPDLEPPQEIQAATPATNQKKNKKEKEVEPKQEDIDYAYTELDNTDTEKPLVKEPSKTAKDETKKKDDTKTAAKEETKVAAKQETKSEPKIIEKKPESEPKVAETKPESEPVKTVAETKSESVDESGRYTVQVMATASKPKAEAQLAALQQKGYTAFMNEEKAAGSPVFKVRVGKFSDADTAR